MRVCFNILICESSKKKSNKFSKSDTQTNCAETWGATHHLCHFHIYSTLRIKYIRNRIYLPAFSMETRDFCWVFLWQRVAVYFSLLLFYSLSKGSFVFVVGFFMIPFWLHSFHIWPGAPNIYKYYTSLLCIIISSWVLLLIKALPNKLSFFFFHKEHRHTLKEKESKEKVPTSNKVLCMHIR